MAVRLLSLDSFKFCVMGKLLQDAAADVVTLCALRVHPGAGTDHVPLNREYSPASYKTQQSYHGPKQILETGKEI